MNSKICVAFCANRAILPGLQASIVSMVRSCSAPERLRIYIFSDDLNEADIQSIRCAIESLCHKEALKLRTADCSAFQHLKSLQGDWMTYFRLFLPELLQGYDNIVYLDSDLVLRLDVAELVAHAPQNSPFAAAGVGNILSALESEFFQSIGMQPDDPSLNAGVLVFNSTVCKDIRFFERCMEFAEKHPNDLQSADQTILTAVFSREFSPLPNQFNRALTAGNSHPNDDEAAIFHFIGSPKPWDLGGRFVHRSAKLWSGTIKGTKYSHSRWLIKNWRSVLKRTWTIRRSYLREILRRFQTS